MSESKKSKKKLIIVIVILLVLVVLGVGLYFILNNRKKETTTNESEIKEYFSEYRMSGNNLEDFDLQFLLLENDNKNMVYSPLSIKYTLAMLSEGTKNDSNGQIDALIGDYTTKKYVNSSNMSFANAMFIKNSFKSSVKDSYTTNIQDKFNAEVIFDEFENARNINNWIKDKTFGLIDNLVNDVDNKNFYLINALAIDMEWNKLIQATSKSYSTDLYYVDYLHEDYAVSIEAITADSYGTVKFNDRTFDSKAVEIGASINNYDIVNDLGRDNIRETITSEYNEFVSSGGCGNDTFEDTDTFVEKFIDELDSNYKQVDFSTDFKFYDDDQVKMFSKDLKEYDGTTLEYIGIMPKSGTLNNFIKNTNASKLNQYIANLKAIELNNFEEGKVTKIIGGIPLFKYDYELDLINDLKKLGVTDVFSGKADFSSITDDSISLDDVKHKATIEFSNEGIKAAAATPAGGAGDASCRFEHLYEVPVVTIDLTFDNPYMYIIRDKNSGEVWFMGTVYEPIENTIQDARIINK